MKCSIWKCPNAKGSNNFINFYPFPDDLEIRAVWAAATGIKDFIPTHNSKLCGRHFTEACYKFAGLQLVLRSDAVPTECLSKDASKLVSEYLKEKQQNDTITWELKRKISNKEEKPPTNNTQKGKIKLVDMRKLLEPHLLEQRTVYNEHLGGDSNTLSKPQPNIRDSSNSNSLLNKHSVNLNTLPTETFVNDTEVSTGVKTEITRLQVFSCLNALLPSSINFFHLKPNEKLACLVMRYCKLDEKNKVIEKAVIDHLKNIIEQGSNIVKAGISVDRTNLPYTKLNDGIVDDGSFNVEKNNDNFQTKHTVSVGQEGLTTIYYENSEVGAVGCSEPKEFIFVNVDGPVEITHESEDLNLSSLRSNKRKRNDEDTDWNPENKIAHKNPDCKVQSQPSLEQLSEIVTYLHKNKLTAKDVLSNFQHLLRLLLELCKRVNSKDSKDIKIKLNYLIDNNIDMKNLDDHLHKFYNKQKPLILKQVIDNKTKVKLSNDVKLRMRPVVVLQDLFAFRMDQLLFKKRDTGEELERNDLYSQTSFSLEKNLNQKYSSEVVKNLTSESFKQFRRIVLNRDGTKAVFQRKYAKLIPGTVVFVKDFSRPHLGWLKGVIKKSEGPTKYQVELDNGNLWFCTADQLRPVLNASDEA